MIPLQEADDEKPSTWELHFCKLRLGQDCSSLLKPNLEKGAIVASALLNQIRIQYAAHNGELGVERWKLISLKISGGSLTPSQEQDEAQSPQLASGTSVPC